MKYEYHIHDLLKTNEIRHSTNSVLTAAVGLVGCAVDGVVVGGGGGIVVVVAFANRLGKLQLGVLQQHPPTLFVPPKSSNV